MPGKSYARGPLRSRIARRRVQIRLSEKRLAELTGLSLRQVQRYCAGEIKDPRLSELVNLAMALDCRLEDILEPEFLEWTVFDATNAPEPPESGHWLS